jgi:hypothetical protein
VKVMYAFILLYFSSAAAPGAVVPIVVDLWGDRRRCAPSCLAPSHLVRLVALAPRKKGFFVGKTLSLADEGY